MKLKKLLNSLFFIFIFSGSAFSQDIHFTMWDMAPLTVNPAFTGAYSGSFRVGGIYRDQWRGLGNANFSTPSGMIDAPIIRGFRKNDWVGIGIMMYQDRAGTFRLGTSSQQLSAAYHLGLNKKATSTLTLGFQGGSVTRNFEIGPRANLIVAPEENSEFGGDADKTYTDYKAGLLFKTEMGKKSDLAIGFSVGHLTNPLYSLPAVTPSDTMGQGSNPPNFQGGPHRRPIMTQFHAQYNQKMTDKWTLSPQLLFQTQGNATEFSAQIWNGFDLSEKYDFRAGLGYRVADTPDATLLLGVDYKENVRVTAAWDYNLGELAGNNGFEIAAHYIIKIFKKPDIDPTILCPKL